MGIEKYVPIAGVHYLYGVRRLIFGADAVNKVGEEAKRLAGIICKCVERRHNPN